MSGENAQLAGIEIPSAEIWSEAKEPLQILIIALLVLILLCLIPSKK